jgi:hypothetical protein
VYNSKISFFIVGFQKCATTWLHRCLSEHPNVFLPRQHMLHYFDINYSLGSMWYDRYYEKSSSSQILGDSTVTYGRDVHALQRVAEYNPEAKIIYLLRNPINRAFSHYWHEKKKRKISFKFEELFTNYDLFENWIKPGFYAQHIDQIMKLFPEKQILILLTDDINNHPHRVLREVFEFIGVDPNFLPSKHKIKINEAWAKPTFWELAKLKIKKILHNVFSWLPECLKRMMHRPALYIGRVLRYESEYKQGMSEETRDRLRYIFRSDINRLESILKRDLRHWLE